MNKWKKRNHGLIVNIYQVMKMLDGESIEATKEMLKESYDAERDTRFKYSKTYNLTFAEYVNEKRHWVACMIGESKYA